MRVIITGGCGFIGQMLARSVLRRGSLVTHAAGGEVTAAVSELYLADVSAPPALMFKELEADPVSVKLGSVADLSFCESLFAGATSVSVFHLGAIMSGQGESDFDLCMDVNLRGTLNMLEVARSCAALRPRFIMASAGATLGAGAPTDFVSKDDVVADWTRATPHTTYGMTKACAELLLGDYSRRGFVDGRACRLPTVVVRAGAPNAATTGCFSAAVREPLAGRDTTSPIGPEVRHAVTGHRTAVGALHELHELPAATVDAVLGYDRTVFIPCLAATMKDLEAAVRTVVSPSSLGALGKVVYEENEALSAAVGSFPTKVDCSRALALGLPDVPDPETLVRHYCEDFPDDLSPAIEILPPTPQVDLGDCTVALITGGGTGIGKAVAARLARGGWQRDGETAVLVLTGRRRGVLEEAAEEARAAAASVGCKVETYAHAADLTSETEVNGLFGAIRQRYGRLDLVFNNAGANVPPTPFGDFGLKEWRQIVDINLNAAFHVARESYRVMREQQPQGGRIINNGSISAAVPRPYAAAYTATKHAITGLTKQIALDGREHSVSCGQIDYGNVVSAISAGMAVGMPQADGSIKPEPRMSQADAADAVHYMAALPLSANVLQMTVMASHMPFVGRG